MMTRVVCSSIHHFAQSSTSSSSSLIVLPKIAHTETEQCNTLQSSEESVCEESVQSAGGAHTVNSVFSPQQYIIEAEAD